ncbi:putative Phosphatase 2C family protein [Quillaja saponaria]|uniref:protein-serine/threonine phosphatase n=1 Tax=Quillaja saponaria TaxID=32244 RepID=A0AAD7VND5_QUISA|nr:putative Phosphatase 2C family protein [Quillaja saponaria]
MASHCFPVADKNFDCIFSKKLPISNSNSSINVLAPTSAVSSSLKRKRPPKIEIPNVLKEVSTEKPRNLLSQSEAVCFGEFGFGVFSVKGKKKLMEDAHKVVPCLEGNPKKGFFGVYDGHGGKKAADFVADNLHANIFKMMENCEESKGKVSALKNGYLKTDEEFLKQGVGSGACCVTALIEGHEIVVSNLGDCRAVLCRGGVAEAITRDHRVEQERERKRIEDKGGYVEFHKEAWRVHGILSVSRSIGDAHLKDWVLAEPDTKILKLTPDIEFLVLASDGLWDEVDIQEAVDMVTRLCPIGNNPGPLGDIHKDSNVDYGCVNISPSSKLRKISLVKQPRGTSPSTCSKIAFKSWKGIKDEFACENGSPPSKSRRISLVKRVNMKIESPTNENSNFKKRDATEGLVAACKELVNLAVSRGSLDDITVMIIDLNHFRYNN